MSYFHHDPDEWESVVTTHTCHFHEVNPGAPYGGCTCSGSWGQKRRAPEEVARIKTRKRLEEEDRILKAADSIRVRRLAEGQA